MAPAKERPATKTIATNREARHEYFVLEALETGVELKGTEVKSLRAGGVNLKDSWVDIEDGELYACAAFALLQAWPRENGSGALQRQKALR